MFEPILISEALRMFYRSLRIRFKGYKRYKGNAAQICTQIVDDCWNGSCYQVSNGNYNEFYCRDFGIVTESLLALGHREKVVKTLEYAMATYAKHGRITQIISHGGKPFEFPYYSADGLPFLLRSINAAKAHHLIEDYKEFLNLEIARYYERVFDGQTGLVKKDPHISGMRDYALRVSPCYHNCMLAMLSCEISLAGLTNPFKGYNFKKLLIKNFWRGTHFIDDLSGKDHITGDANVFPFWCDIVGSKKMLKSAVSMMQHKKLDEPFPLRYYYDRSKHQDMIWQDMLVKNWEKDTAWLHLGLCYLDIVRRCDKKLHDEYLQRYCELVEHHGTLLELFEPDGKPVKNWVYHADDGLIWSAKLLCHLLQRDMSNKS